MQRTFGYLLLGFSIVLAFLTIGSLVIDLAFPVVRGDTLLSRQGFSHGLFIGAIVSTLISLAIAYGIWKLGLANFDPTNFSSDAINQRRLKEIAAKHDISDQPTDSDDIKMYQGKSATELIDIYKFINRDCNPIRFNSLVVVIGERCEIDAL